MKRLIYIYSILLVVGLLLTHNNLSASCQCPSDIPPTNLNWTTESTSMTIIDDMGRPCRFEVSYCWRNLSDSIITPTTDMIEIFVCEFSPIPVCHPEFTLPMFQILKRLTEQIILMNPNQNDWPIPPCPYTTGNYATYLMNCYDNVEQIPCGASFYCRYLYAVCSAGGQRTIQELGSESLGGDCPIGCSSPCGN